MTQTKSDNRLSEQELSPEKKITAAAVDLYENHLKGGCQRLLVLNKILIQAERKQRIRRVLYRLGWVGGLSIFVMIVSYLFIGINMLTAIGLLVAYFAGLLLHGKFSPGIVLPKKEEDELFQLNDQLRQVILDAEKENKGLLYPLLRKAGLKKEARSKGLTLEEGEIDMYQLDGGGLYQYLDAMNLLMQNRERLTK